jgi:hypothetical protein
MGFLQTLSVAAVALASGAQAAVTSTGFTVSLQDVDYFLPPKPVARITGCEEIKAAFGDATFVPITVVSGNGTLDVKAYGEDDVWQEAFLQGMWRVQMAIRVRY